MNFKLAIILAFSTLFSVSLYGQSDTYVVTRTTFSSDRYDEFSPSYYNNGLVFCSNRNPNQIKKYTDSQNRGVFKIFYIDTTANVNWIDAKLFSKKLTSNLNDGPATFSANGATVYFSRNIIADGKVSEISSQRNTLGIFYSTFDGSYWKDPREFRFNNEWHNITTPCLSPDGKRLYFASDKDGGYGGSDLYYCEWGTSYWGDPVNLGPVINTSGNEAYPFITANDELYFSSDMHPGLGGKDIFFSKLMDSTWCAPAHLDPPINSGSDDFGLITSEVMDYGYFSSNREGSLDIYNFKTLSPQLFCSKQQVRNKYLFKFTDDKSIQIDSQYMQFEWEFGDGSTIKGDEIDHSFPGPGKYFVKQNILDSRTGRKLFTKQLFDLEIKEIEQPFITCPDLALSKDQIYFDARKSNVPKYEIQDYLWDFGDGQKASGISTRHSFDNQGNYFVKLGLIVKEKNTGIISKLVIARELRILNSPEALNLSGNSKQESVDNITIPEEYDHAFITRRYSATDELQKGAVFQVEILSSKTRISSLFFENISDKYFVKEVNIPTSETYSYVVCEESDFSLAAAIYMDLLSMGFKEAKIRTSIPINPAERELNNLFRVYGQASDIFFLINSTRLSSGGIAVLDQVSNIIEKYPEIKVVVEVHSENAGPAAMNLALSKQQAQSIVSYITGRGISRNRIIAKGYGNARPVSSDNTEGGRSRNRRVIFMVVY